MLGAIWTSRKLVLSHVTQKHQKKLQKILQQCQVLPSQKTWMPLPVVAHWGPFSSYLWTTVLTASYLGLPCRPGNYLKAWTDSLKAWLWSSLRHLIISRASSDPRFECPSDAVLWRTSATTPMQGSQIGTAASNLRRNGETGPRTGKCVVAVVGPWRSFD